MEKEPKGYSTINGQPLPEGKPFVAGDSRAVEAQKKSVESRKARKTLREELLTLLSTEVKVDGKKRSVQEAVSTALTKQAMKGNTRAFEIIRDTIGEKPIEKVMLAEVEQSVIDEVERAVVDGQTANT